MAGSHPCHQHAHAQAWPKKDMTVWNQNRETIHRLFLHENCALAQVKNVLESEYAFPEFRLIDYEVILREHFGFRKNLKKEDWLAIEYHREQRRRRGKTSNVYLQGILLEKPRVDRAVRRSENDRKLPYKSRREPGPAYPLPEGITMRTPSPVLPSRPWVPGMRTTNTTNILPIRPLGQSVHQAAPGWDTLPIDISTIQGQLHVQVPLEEMRLHLPFNKFAEVIKLNFNVGMSPSPIYTDVHHPSPGSVQLPGRHDILTSPEIHGNSYQGAKPRQNNMNEEDQKDRLAARNIPFIGGRFEFDKLMRLFFVLSNKQRIHKDEGGEIIEWIVSADPSVVKSLFTIPLHTVASAWEYLMDISFVLNYPDAVSKLLQACLDVRSIEWLKARAGKVLSIAIWLGVKEWYQRLLSMGLSPNGRVVGFNTVHFLDQRFPMSFNHIACFTPIDVAIARSDAHAIAMLLQHGVRPNRHNIGIMGLTLVDPLFARRRSYAAQLDCLRLLLEAGAPSDFLHSYDDEKGCFGEISLRRLGWLPGTPVWFSDILWHHSAKNKSLRQHFDLVSQYSNRIKSSLTVPGLCDAASHGCGELLGYLNSRASPLGKDRDVLLEIALSEVAIRGDLMASHTFIQIGVDPMVRTIYNHTSRCCGEFELGEPWRRLAIIESSASIWVPAIQASRNSDTRLLGLLFDVGVSPNQHNLVDALLSEDGHSWTELCGDRYPDGQFLDKDIDNSQALAPEKVNNTYNYLLTAGFDIEAYGSAAMAHAVMRWKESEPETAYLQCDWLHSKGVPWHVELEGRNLIHLAVRYGCDLNLIRFLVARGVEVHSSPCLDDKTMLYEALEMGCTLEVIEFLLQHGADINDQSYGGVSTLEPALFLGTHSLRLFSTLDTAAICRKLIGNGATIVSWRQACPEKIRPPRTLLAKLIQLREIEDNLILRMLESTESLDLFYDTRILESDKSLDLTIDHKFRNWKNNLTPIQAAIEAGRLDMVKRLLPRAETIVDAPLLFSQALLSATKLCVEFVDEVVALEFMTYLSKSAPDINWLGVHGINSLHFAVQNGSLNIASILLQNGANPNTPMKRVLFNPRVRYTDVEKFRIPQPLVFRQHSEVDLDDGEVDERIAYNALGCPIFDHAMYGPLLEPRALDLAAFNGRLDMVQLLLNAGGISGFPDITPYGGAIESALYNGHHTIVSLLKEAAEHRMSTGESFDMSDGYHGSLIHDSASGS